MNTNSYKCCNTQTDTHSDIQYVSSVLQLIADTGKLQLMCILSSGTHCVCELMEHTDMSQSLISHQLKKLLLAGMATKERQGNRMYYQLTDKGKTIYKKVMEI